MLASEHKELEAMKVTLEKNIRVERSVLEGLKRDVTERIQRLIAARKKFAKQRVSQGLQWHKYSFAVSKM